MAYPFSINGEEFTEADFAPWTYPKNWLRLFDAVGGGFSAFAGQLATLSAALAEFYEYLAETGDHGATETARLLNFASEEVGSLDATGVSDQRALINAAFVGSALAGKTLYIGKGQYRLSGSLYVKSGLKLVCHPQAEFIGYFTTNGGYGLVTADAAARAAMPANPLRNISIEGGIWRRDGTVSTDGKTYSGYRGNIFSFWAEHVDIKRVSIRRYQSGRAFLVGGRHWTIDQVWSFDPDHPMGLPCPAVGGTGAIRWYSGGAATITRCFAIAGDDLWQTVPGATDSDGIDVYDVTYADCWGISYKARAMVCGLVVPNRFDEDLQNSLTLSIKNVTFRGIRGFAFSPAAISNTDSAGRLGTVLFDDCAIGVIPDLDGNVSQYAINILGGGLTGGAGPVIFQNFELLNVIEGGLRLRGTDVGRVELHSMIIPPASNAATSYYPLHAQDCEKLIIHGGKMSGPVGGTKSILYLGRNDLATSIDHADIEGLEIANIPDGAFGIYCPNNGVEELILDKVKFVPSAGATTSGGVRYSEIATLARVRSCDLSRLGGAPFSNIPAGKFIASNDNLLPASALTTNGFLFQNLAVGSALAWNGHSETIRVTAGSGGTIDSIDIPAGYLPRDKVPEVHLLGVNAFTHTISASGNLVPRAPATLSQSDLLRFRYDHMSSKWRQAA